MSIKNAEKYAEIKLKMLDLAEKLEVLQAKLLADMEKEAVDRLPTDYGTISLVHRKAWTYSDKVAKLSKKVQEEKKIEEIKGIATYVENLGLMFKAE